MCPPVSPVASLDRPGEPVDCLAARALELDHGAPQRLVGLLYLGEVHDDAGVADDPALGVAHGGVGGQRREDLLAGALHGQLALSAFTGEQLADHLRSLLA
jgi:hypothetical protein